MIYTIGHSSHELDRFVELLKQHAIDVLADVRSQPWSAFTPQLNQNALQAELPAREIKYLFLGEQLGGRPPGDCLYDAEGHVLYHRVAEQPFFRAGIERVKAGLAKGLRIALMCSEEDPAICHRCLLVTRVLGDEGVAIQHIRGDGTLQSEQQVRGQRGDDRNQGLLFGEMEHDDWKSLRSVLPKAQPLDSSGG